MIPKEGREYILDAAFYNLHSYCFAGNNKRRMLSEGDLLGTIRGNGLGPVLEEGDVDEIINEMITNSVIQTQKDKYAGRFFIVTDELKTIVRDRSDDGSTPLFQMNRFGADWIAAAVQGVYAANETEIDAGSENSIVGQASQWNQPDISHQIDQQSIDEIRTHLSECIKIISASNFTQEEKSQISGLLRVCEGLIDLPTPKVSLIKQVLSWLRDIAAIKELVDKILEHLDF